MHSDLAIFSFHPVKTITTGEGGAVLTNDDKLAERIRLMRSHGIERRSDLLTRTMGHGTRNDGFSYNCRITDFQCALVNRN